MTEADVRRIVKEEIALAISKKGKRKRIEINVTDEMQAVYEMYYRIGGGLPVKSKSFTKKFKLAVSDALLKFSLEDIESALQIASNSWIQNKHDEIWMTESWVMGRVEEWMPDGKYYDTIKKMDKATSVDVSSDADFDDIF